MLPMNAQAAPAQSVEEQLFYRASYLWENTLQGALHRGLSANEAVDAANAVLEAFNEKFLPNKKEA